MWQSLFFQNKPAAQICGSLWRFSVSVRKSGSVCPILSCSSGVKVSNSVASSGAQNTFNLLNCRKSLVSREIFLLDWGIFWVSHLRTKLHFGWKHFFSHCWRISKWFQISESQQNLSSVELTLLEFSNVSQNPDSLVCRFRDKRSHDAAFWFISDILLNVSVAMEFMLLSFRLKSVKWTVVKDLASCVSD